MEQFVRQYPDLAASVIKGVFDSVAGNVDQAQRILSQFTGEEVEEEELQKRLRELEADFGVLGQEVLRRVLKENKGDVEKAFVPLLGLLEKKKEEEMEDKKRLKKEEAKADANRFLTDLFNKVPQKQIRQMVDDNDGDVDKTTEQLLEFMRRNDHEEKKKKEAEQITLFRKQQVDALAIRFSTSTREVERLLAAKNWDIDAGIQILLKAEQEKKIDRIKKIYPLRRAEEIIHVLEENMYDEVKALNVIEHRVEYENQQRMRKEMEEEKKKEEERRREQERKKEEMRRQEEERKKLEAIKETEKRLEMEKKWEAERKREEQKRKEQEMKVLAERELKRKEEELKTEVKRKEEEERILEGQNEALIRQSILIAKEINQEVEENNDYLIKAIGNELRVMPTGRSPDVINKTKTEAVNNQVIMSANEMVDYGETITLKWSNAPQGTRNNWIGFYQEGASSTKYISYHWVEGDQGTLDIKAPTTSGNYLFRFYINKSYVNWGTSEIIKVGPTFTMTPTVINNAEVIIAVNQQSGQACPNAWVGLYEPSKDNSKYVTYYYLGSNTNLTFKIPKVGIWEFRLFPQKALNVATSCRVNLTGSDSLQLTLNTNTNKSNAEIQISYNVLTLDPSTDSPWVGVFAHTETDIKQYRRYRYITSRSGEIIMDAMKTPGSYEARLYAAGSEKIYCRSNIIVISPPPISFVSY